MLIEGYMVPNQVKHKMIFKYYFHLRDNLQTWGKISISV